MKQHNIQFLGPRGNVCAPLADISQALGVKLDSFAFNYIKSTARHATMSMLPDRAPRNVGLMFELCIWSSMLAQFLVVHARYDGQKAWSICGLSTPDVQRVMEFRSSSGDGFYPFSEFTEEEVVLIAQRAVDIIVAEQAEKTATPPDESVVYAPYGPLPAETYRAIELILADDSETLGAA